MLKYTGEETKKALKNFQISGRYVSISLIHALAAVKIAAAKANNKSGKLSNKKAALIIKVCEEIISGKLDSEFILDAIQGGAGTSINMNINEVIAHRANKIDPASQIHYLDDVNKSQSTNDVMPTALRLSLLRLLDSYIESLTDLENSFGNKANEFKAIKKPGRTHLQDAVEITLGQESRAYESFVKRDKVRLSEFRKYLLQTNLGGTAIGTSVATDKHYTERVNKYLSSLTGYPFEPSEDLIDATQNIDSFLHLAGLLNTSALALSKIANDLRLMASGPNAGLGEIKLPEFQKGSTIMPGKNNPVTLEAFNQIAMKVNGNFTIASNVMLAGQLELNVMFPILADSLIESLSILITGTKMFADTVNKIEANKDRCEELVSNSRLLGAELGAKIGYEKAEEKLK